MYFIVEQSWQRDHWRDESSRPFKQRMYAMRYAKQEACEWLNIRKDNSTYRYEETQTDFTVFLNDKPWYRYHLTK